MPTSGRMQGKVVFITGVARGMGRSHAVRLAAEGADIIGLDLCRDVGAVGYPLATAEDLEETKRLVRACGRQCVTDVADVRDYEHVHSVLAKGVTELGRLDAVVANAGIFAAAPTLTMDESVWREHLEINLTGVWNTARAAAPVLIDAGRGGSMVLVSSAAALTANPNTAHYTASKHGVVGLMRVLATELGQHRIRVNTVNPTGVATPMVLNEANYRLFRSDLDEPTAADLDAVAGTGNKLPVGLIEPEDVTNAVVYLLSDESRYVTGITLPIDAGLSL
jgi:SDR family mycofactocin-dependent oxidoreductase